MALSSGSTASPATGEQVLRSAASQLREHVDGRWVEIADAVVARALAASRPSWPVLAQAGGGPVRVTEQVLVTYLRDSLAAVDGCETVAISVRTDDEVCTGLVIAVAARYGTVLVPLADRVRTVAESTLARLLGPVSPPVTVEQMHVHVSDVTPGDPSA